MVKRKKHDKLYEVTLPSELPWPEGLFEIDYQSLASRYLEVIRTRGVKSLHAAFSRRQAVQFAMHDYFGGDDDYQTMYRCVQPEGHTCKPGLARFIRFVDENQGILFDLV